MVYLCGMDKQEYIRFLEKGVIRLIIDNRFNVIMVCEAVLPKEINEIPKQVFKNASKQIRSNETYISEILKSIEDSLSNENCNFSKEELRICFCAKIIARHFMDIDLDISDRIPFWVNTFKTIEDEAEFLFFRQLKKYYTDLCNTSKK